jgi:hypothetical protein
LRQVAAVAQTDDFQQNYTLQCGITLQGVPLVEAQMKRKGGDSWQLW